VELVRNSTDTGLTKCVKNFKGECDKINESIKDYKMQTDASMNSLRSVVNQNRAELENKIDELTHEVRSVASGIEECNSSRQMDKGNYQLEIQRLDFQIEILRTNFNGNLAIQTESAVYASQQFSTTIRVIDIGQLTSQATPAASESNSRKSPGLNGVIISNTSECNIVSNSSTVAASGIESVIARSKTTLTLANIMLSLLKFADSSQQVAVQFIRELDEFFLLRKKPEELRLPLVFRSNSEPFAKQ